MFSQLRIVQKLSAPVWAPQFYLYQNVYSFQSLHKFYILTVKETFLPTWLCSKDNQADRAVSRAGAETVRQAGVSTFLAGRHSVHLYCVKLARETSRVSLVLEQESSWVAAEPSSSSVQRWPPHHTSPSQTQHSGGNQHDLPAKLFPSWHYTPSGTGDCRVWTGQGKGFLNNLHNWRVVTCQLSSNLDLPRVGSQLASCTIRSQPVWGEVIGLLLFLDCHKTTNTSASLSDTAIMVLQLEQIPEGAVAINDGEENREASETGSEYLRELHTITFIWYSNLILLVTIINYYN